MNISEETLQAIRKYLRKDASTSGIQLGSNLSFYFLEEQAKHLYQVFYPILASIARANPTYAGKKVGGTGVNWKAITSIDANGYGGVSEGNRNEVMNIKTRDYYAPFKFIGKETEVSFQAESEGVGFDDNIGNAQLALLAAVLNDEEKMTLYGNSGSGSNGYQLGTSPTPVAALQTGAGIPDATKISAFVIALTPWGTQFATATGCALPRVRTNADGSTDVINGGTGAVSAASNIVTTSSGAGNQQVKLTCAAKNGAVGYAWYVDATDTVTPSKANSKFAGITVGPLAIVGDGTNGTLPYGGVASAQLASASLAGADFTTDNSANALDYDGLLTWAFNYAGNSMPSYVKDLAGAGLTSNGDGTIAEFETAFDFFWSNYKIAIDKIYVGGTLISAVSKAVMTGSGGPGAQRLMFESNAAGAITGGTKVVQYRSKYSNRGAAKVLDVETHPWLPAGVVYFDLQNNPFPQAANAIPAVRRIISLEDHFSIKWPYRRLKHELGTYAFQTLQHYIPFGTGVLTGVANKVN